nr:immunoglobulin light chain junction region [Macaca mulatta]
DYYCQSYDNILSADVF